MQATEKKKPPISSLWDNRKLGASEKFVRKASAAREKALDENLGLQTISIRLQKNLIDNLKELAEEDGIGHQPYVRQLLTRHVRSEKAKRGRHIQAMQG